MYTGYYRLIKFLVRVAEFHKQRSVWRIGTTSFGEFPTTSLVHDTQEQLRKFDGAPQWKNSQVHKTKINSGEEQNINVQTFPPLFQTSLAA